MSNDRLFHVTIPFCRWQDWLGPGVDLWPSLELLLLVHTIL